MWVISPFLVFLFISSLFRNGQLSAVGVVWRWRARSTATTSAAAVAGVRVDVGVVALSGTGRSDDLLPAAALVPGAARHHAQYHVGEDSGIVVG